jgi:molybdate transport system substrate-binding protein
MQLHLLSGGAAHGLVMALEDRFKTATGLDIAGTFSAVGALKEKLISGAPADLVILTRQMISDLEQEGFVEPGSTVDIGVVHTGVAVRQGDPLPAIGTAPALRDALRAADQIYFPDPSLATAGIHFAKVLRQLGVGEELNDRLRTFPNGATAMAALARQQGGRPIGCTQVTEILGTPGACLVGRLPHELELSTVYAAGIAARAVSPEAARTLADLLVSDAAAAARQQTGFAAKV